MNLIDSIRAEPALQPYIIDRCEENGLCVQFSSDISKEDYVIIKVDDFYNHCDDYKLAEDKLMYAPPSIDCLIVLACTTKDKYRILLVELKNTPARPEKQNMVGKFETTLRNFMSERFGNYFYRETDVLEIGLYLHIATLRGQDTLRSVQADYLLSLGTIRFGSRYYSFKNLESIVQPC